MNTSLNTAIRSRNRWRCSCQTNRTRKLEPTTRHDLFTNANRGARSSYPLVVLLQAGAVDSTTQVVAPLIVLSARVPNSRLLPLVEHDGATYAVMFGLVTHLSARLLRHAVGSIAHYRDDLTRALDWLFFGI